MHGPLVSPVRALFLNAPTPGFSPPIPRGPHPSAEQPAAGRRPTEIQRTVGKNEGRTEGGHRRPTRCRRPVGITTSQSPGIGEGGGAGSSPPLLAFCRWLSSLTEPSPLPIPTPCFPGEKETKEGGNPGEEGDDEEEKEPSIMHHWTGGTFFVYICFYFKYTVSFPIGTFATNPAPTNVQVSPLTRLPM